MLTLSNFRLIPTSLIEIEALGLLWNLHGYADFLGCDYSVQSQTVKLSWRMSASANDYPELPKYPSEWFDLLFSRVIYFEVSPRDPAMPLEEDAQLDTVSFMAASDETSEYLHNYMIPAFDPEVNPGDYHILFRFRGGLMIRIGAEEGEFILVENAPH